MGRGEGCVRALLRLGGRLRTRHLKRNRLIASRKLDFELLIHRPNTCEQIKMLFRFVCTRDFVAGEGALGASQWREAG